MAVLGQAQVTLTDLTDISALTIYYYQQTSTLAAPAKPTVKTPTGWVTTEPSVDTTKSLYSSTRTDWSNGEFTWSDVSLSSSYEAAKAAYNKAVSAQDTANSANNKITYTYGTCTTAAATAAKAVTITNFPTLYSGARCSVKFTYANSVASPTISINSGTAYSIHAYGSVLSATSFYNWTAGATVDFIFDGTYWNIIDSGSLDKSLTAQNTATTAYSRASYCYGTCDTANTVYAKVATLTNFPSLYTGATCAIKFTYGSSKPGFITDKTDSSYEAPTTLTLNVNGTGAKEIHSYSVAITNEPTDYSWIDGAILNLIYDGTSWVIVESSLLSKIISTNNEVSKRVSSSQLQQTADNITASFGTSIKNISNNLNTTNIGLQDATNRIDTINSMVQIGADETTGTPYLFLGKQGSDFSVTLTNSELDFTDQGVVVASMSNQELHILTAIISSTIGVGNWRWMARANNHLSLTYGSDS